MKSLDNICLIGLGEIGSAVLEDMSGTLADRRIIGVDIDAAKVAELNAKGYQCQTNIPDDCDVYIISLWTTQEILRVIAQLDFLGIFAKRNPLVSIESTYDPKYLKELYQYRDCSIVAFPHRFNPNDPAHRVFNLDRVLGGINEDAKANGLIFYGQFMDKKLIHTTDLPTAVVSKVVENAYRYMEIVIAQELKTHLEPLGIDFYALRSAVGSKWNVSLMQALQGVQGKCLPKDLGLLESFAPSLDLVKHIRHLNEDYIKDNDKKS